MLRPSALLRPFAFLALLVLSYPAARANVLGIHTMIQDNNETIPQLDQSAALCGWGGWVKQLMYVQDGTQWSFDPKWTAFVDGARQRHLNVVARLHYLPPNYRADPNNFASKPKNDADGSFTTYKNLIKSFVQRFNGHLHYVEIWNEPNLSYEWNTYPSPAEFVKVMMAGYDGAKEADPTCRVLFPGLAPTDGTSDGQNINNLTFLENCLKSTYTCPRDGKKFADHFDILGSHPYPLNHPATYASDKYSIFGYVYELNVLTKYGVTKPVLITETGYALGNQDDSRYPAVTEQFRADNMVLAFQAWAQDGRVLGAMPYFLHAAERTPDRPFFWIRDDGSHTPMYDAVQHLKYTLADKPGNIVNAFPNFGRSYDDPVDMADVMQVLQIATGAIPAGSVDPFRITTADVDPPAAPDDVLTIADAARILRFTAGLDADSSW